MASNADYIINGFGGLNQDIQQGMPREDPKATAFQRHLARVLQGEDPLQVAHEYHATKQQTLAAPQQVSLQVPQATSQQGPMASGYAMPQQSLGGGMPDYSQNYQQPQMGPQGLGAPLAPAPRPQAQGPGLASTGSSNYGNVAVNMPQQRSQMPMDIDTQGDFDSLMQSLRLRDEQKRITSMRSQEDILAQIAARGAQTRDTETLKGGIKGGLQDTRIGAKASLQDDQQDFAGGENEKKRKSTERMDSANRTERGREADNRIEAAYARLEVEKKKNAAAGVVYKQLADARKEIGQGIQEKNAAEADKQRIIASGQGQLPEGKAEMARNESRLLAAEEQIAKGRARADDIVATLDAHDTPNIIETEKKTVTKVKGPAAPKTPAPVTGNVTAKGGRVKMSNGKETMMVDPADVNDARSEGFKVIQ